MIASDTNAAADIPVIRIEPSTSRLPAVTLNELWEYRELLYFLVWRDVKVLYKQTAIGASWAIVQPLLTMVIFTVVFDRFAKMPSDGLPYPIFSYTALLPWTYFSKALNQSIQSVVHNSNLITKVYFPRPLLPISAILSGIIDFGISFVFLISMMIWYGIMPGWGTLFLPGFVLMTILTALSISLWLSAINVRYRDVGQAIPFLIQIWMFASPVAYPVSVVPENWRLLYSLNPMVGVIEGFRWALLGKATPEILPIVISIAVVLALLFSGMVFFKRMEETFADVV
ncbi:MAG TPA: ABC transporter permease [Candidatus Udaeobacter sp.]|jgi:lipopolysaccharide transport system permease protein|nr:ABC transporter permease [Candidatus Udaeobacter sp.]